MDTTGVIGIRASGKLTKVDYQRVLRPGREGGDRLRRCPGALRSPGLRRVSSPKAFFEDVKTGLEVELRNRSAWKRFAFVSGVDWITKAMRLFTWALLLRSRRAGGSYAPEVESLEGALDIAQPAPHARFEAAELGARARSAGAHG